MWFVRRHDDHLAFFEQAGGLFYGYLCFAINDHGDCIIRRGVFRQSFAGIKGKECDGTALFVHDHTTDYRPLLVIDQVFGTDDLFSEVFISLPGHRITDE